MTPSPEEKRSALEEVLQSTTFLRADQLRKFLRYICEMEISGRAGELCESLIGVEALGQPANYSTTENGFVRRRALDLREKLRETYATELASAKVRIELPKGRYVPRFELVEPIKDGLELAATTNGAQLLRGDHRPWPGATPVQHPFNALRFAVAFALGSLVTTLVFLFLPSLRPSRTVEPGVTYEADAKTNLFSGATNPFPCSDCGNSTSKVRDIGGGPMNFVIFRDIIIGKSGNYVVVIYYVLSGSRSFFVSVNDGPGIEVPLTGDSWAQIKRVAITVPLNAGSNKIKFYNDNSAAPDLIRIIIRSMS
jgi:hypothetical protein